MFNEAIAIQKMLSVRDMTQAKLAGVLGVSQPYIANKLRLLDYSDEARERILKYGLSERHARTILRLKDEGERLSAIEKTHIGKKNVAECEIMVDCMLEAESRKAISECSPTERIISFERSLEQSIELLHRFGIKAVCSRSVHKDKIYFSICIE